MPRSAPIYTALAIAVLVLTLIPIGTAVFILGFISGDSPCILCWEQRIGMALIALIGLAVLRYGPKPFYLGLAVLVGVWGIYMGVRHSGLHLARDVGQGFSVEILGAHTYTWSFFIFWVCTAAIALLMTLARREDVAAAAPRRLRPLDTAAFAAFLVVIAANVVQAFASTGPPPFVGQADPVRFSFNPRHWVWSLGEYRPAPVSLRGRWAIEKPDVASVDPDAATGPFQGLRQLTVVSRRRLDLPLRGTPTGLAYDARTDRFLVTTQSGLYLTDGSLGRVLRHTVVDPMFSVDLARFAGAAFLDSQTVVAVSENKSFVTLREAATEDPGRADRNFRYFLESPDAFDEVARSRLTTVRAKMMYVMAAAFDPATKSLLTVSVPNANTKRLVVSRFDASDMTLSEEFAPAFTSPGAERLFVTGAVVDGGRLYALSAAHSTLLTIDLASRRIAAAQTVPRLRRPTGLALKDGAFHVITADAELIIVQ